MSHRQVQQAMSLTTLALRNGVAIIVTYSIIQERHFTWLIMVSGYSRHAGCANIMPMFFLLVKPNFQMGLCIGVPWYRNLP